MAGCCQFSAIFTSSSAILLQKRELNDQEILELFFELSWNKTCKLIIANKRHNILSNKVLNLVFPSALIV